MTTIFTKSGHRLSFFWLLGVDSRDFYHADKKKELLAKLRKFKK